MEKYIVENKKVFNFSKKEKKKFFEKNFFKIIKFHQKNCKNYFLIFKKLGFKLTKKTEISETPPIPVSYF